MRNTRMKLIKKEERKGKVLVIVGAQYGSEGKGVIASYLAPEYDIFIRVGGPNAGHTFIHRGEVFKMQAIPCGWTNPKGKIVIGKGALLNLDIFRRELDMIKKFDSHIEDRIFIDFGTGILDPKFAQQEGGTSGEINRRIGSTGEGVGAARVARVNRDPDNFSLAKDALRGTDLDHMLIDTVSFLTAANISGLNIMLEGTQGAALSLIHGPWPYVTSHDTNAAQMLADVGIAPNLVTDIMLVMRTFPIRVAGNSGPMRDETTWGNISKFVGREVEERTTVTNKVRRVGHWDSRLIDRAVLLNNPTEIVINFMDYLDPSDAGKTRFENLSPGNKSFIHAIETTWGVPVTFVGTGGENKFSLIDRR